jgi:diguanylate cyclase (GGDEF)-like protein
VVAASPRVARAAREAVERAGGVAWVARRGAAIGRARLAAADVVIVEEGSAAANGTFERALREWPWTRCIRLRRTGRRRAGPPGVRAMAFDDPADLAARLARALSAPETAAPDRRALREMALRDPLTGLYGRRYFEAVFPRAAASGRGACCVALADVDHFHRVNAEQGLLGGDRVLRDYAARVARRVREPHVLARYGGDELVLLLAGLDARGAAAWADRLRAAVARRPFRVRGGTVRLTLSVGIAPGSPPARRGAEAAIRRADRALRAAKASGRNRVVVWTPAMGDGRWT